MRRSLPAAPVAVDATARGTSPPAASIALIDADDGLSASRYIVDGADEGAPMAGFDCLSEEFAWTDTDAV